MSKKQTPVQRLRLAAYAAQMNGGFLDSIAAELEATEELKPDPDDIPDTTKKVEPPSDTPPILSVRIVDQYEHKTRLAIYLGGMKIGDIVVPKADVLWIAERIRVWPVNRVEELLEGPIG